MTHGCTCVGCAWNLQFLAGSPWRSFCEVKHPHHLLSLPSQCTADGDGVTKIQTHCRRSCLCLCSHLDRML